MVCYPEASLRLATAEDMFSEKAEKRPKCKGPKFSHYRRSRVTKAPRKRTFIMHMTKYPDAWISSLSSPTSAESLSSIQGYLQLDTLENATPGTGPESSFLSSSSDSTQSSACTVFVASPVPLVKRRVSPFAAGCDSAIKICDEDVSKTVANGASAGLSASYSECAASVTSMGVQEDVMDSCAVMINAENAVSEQQLVLLGAGGQGSVYKGMWNGKIVAFKFPLQQGQERQESASVSTLKSFEREVAVLSLYQHPNMISCLKVCRDASCPYIVEEYAERGSVHDWLYTNDVHKKAEALAVLAARAVGQYCSESTALLERLSSLILHTATAAEAGATLKWQEWSAGNLLKYIAILQVLADTASALQYLHTSTPQVVHRDLKPDNVLLTADGVAKLADFGVAKILHPTSVGTADELFGTANYAAPEDLWGNSDLVGPAADVYSLGCIAWECFAGERPWMGCSEYSIMFSVGQGMRHLPLPDSWPSGLKELLGKCLAFDPAVRPTAPEAASALSAELEWATSMMVSLLLNN